MTVADRPVAHRLVVFGFDEEDEPLFHLECQAAKGRVTSQCAEWQECGCNGGVDVEDEHCPTSPAGEHRLVSWGWAYPSGECFLLGYDELRELVHELVERLEGDARGIWAIGWHVEDERVELEPLARLGMAPEFPKRVALQGERMSFVQLPLAGPETDVRDLIEQGVVVTLEDGLLAVDASAVALEILRWVRP